MKALRSCAAMVVAIACCAPAAGARVEDVTSLVNPFVGTDGTGHTFPGASLPFGMVAPSPDNADRGWDYTSGYQYRARRILGFSNTHMSGTGIGELGDVLLQPAQGAHWSLSTTDFSSRYDKPSESAQPGYYAVGLPAHHVTVELTAAQRVAFHRYTFARTGHVQVLLDLQHGIRFNENPRVTRSEVGTDASAGEISGTLHSAQWVDREASFVVHFDRPIDRLEALPARPGDKAPRYLLEFDLGDKRVLEARVAMSTVDVAGARRNLEEVASSGFDDVRADAHRTWGELLGRISIDAPPRQMRTFYSALYHAVLHPSDIADADGRVRGPTGEVSVARGGHYYSTLSLWDTFRGVHPLLTLLAPERVDGMILTLLDHQRAMGYLPLWTAWGRETWTMIGNPALPVIANAVSEGFHGFPRDEALAAMVQTSTAERHGAPAWAQQDWSTYARYGYLPFDVAPGESVSKSLEYGIGDDAVARVAQATGHTDLEQRFDKRAQGYRLLFDPATRMMRGRDSAGRWRTPFDPLTPTSPLNNPGDYTEANAWQYTLTPALHDPQGLVDLLGGRQRFEAWLDAFFTTQAPGDDKHLGQEALIGQYAHGNEPSHHIAYLYAYTDSPWKAHLLIRRISRAFYSDRPDGVTGNDDCGQMSAWYVLSTLGFYPVVPASGDFVAGAPQVRAATLRLPGGLMLKIHADGFGERHPFAASIRLNGQALEPTTLHYRDLMSGGDLRFEMRSVPVKASPASQRRGIE